jgi:hypothetical protein
MTPYFPRDSTIEALGLICKTVASGRQKEPGYPLVPVAGARVIELLATVLHL